MKFSSLIASTTRWLETDALSFGKLTQGNPDAVLVVTTSLGCAALRINRVTASPTVQCIAFARSRIYSKAPDLISKGVLILMRLCKKVNLQIYRKRPKHSFRERDASMRRPRALYHLSKILTFLCIRTPSAFADAPRRCVPTFLSCKSRLKE